MELLKTILTKDRVITIILLLVGLIALLIL